MNNKRVFMLCTALAGLFALPAISSGQLIFERSFDIEGIINPGPGEITEQLYSTVSVKFLETLDTPNNFVDTIEVTVANLSLADSEIVEFFLLNPVLGLEPDLVSLGNWSLKTELSSTMAQFGGLNPNDPVIGEYFGASYDPPTGITVPNSLTFSFTYAPFDFDSASWLDSFGNDDWPNVFIRWQSVYGSESGKGFYNGPGDGPGPDPAVPEPSAIAAMAVIGMGGLLFIRRRLTRKK